MILQQGGYATNSILRKNTELNNDLINITV